MSLAGRGEFDGSVAFNCRKKAREILVQFDKDKDLDGDQATAITLQQAVDMHLEDMRRDECQPR